MLYCLALSSTCGGTSSRFNSTRNKANLDESEHKPSSFDTSGLGLPVLNGHTLVKYGLSLTGRDFRTIAQVAPFVLRGLILAELYETWLCLSKLIPMIWQTEISDIDVYLVSDFPMP